MAAKAQKLAQQAAPQETTSPETSGQVRTAELGWNNRSQSCSAAGQPPAAMP